MFARFEMMRGGKLAVAEVALMVTDVLRDRLFATGEREPLSICRVRSNGPLRHQLALRVDNHVRISCLRASANLPHVAAVSENPRRRRDDKGSDDEREHRGVYRRMHQEKRAGCGADDQRDENSAQSAVLFAG
jgi:hypothetical protein